MRLVDAEGLRCPEPIALLHQATWEVEYGDQIVLVGSDKMLDRDVRRFCQFLEHTLEGMYVIADGYKKTYYFLIRKGL